MQAAQAGHYSTQLCEGMAVRTGQERLAAGMVALHGRTCAQLTLGKADTLDAACAASSDLHTEPGMESC